MLEMSAQANFAIAIAARSFIRAAATRTKGRLRRSNSQEIVAER